MTKYWIALMILLLAGCASVVPSQGFNFGQMLQSKGLPQLNDGIKSYEDGSYREAVGELQGALNAGLSDSEKVKAHKYLAFTYCISHRETLCREEFTKALTIDPNFELAPAEAGHPMWGTVFRSVKRTFK